MTVRKPLVLMYHAVGARAAADDPYNLFVTPETLRHQLRWLLDRGWRALRLCEYLDGPTSGERTFLVTFDDGYAGLADLATPILDELRVPATVFVLPGLLGGYSSWMPDMDYEPLLTPDDVRDLSRAGLDIGVHGWDHTVLPDLTDQDLRTHLADARAALCELTGEVPRAFAYPCGRHDARSRQAVADAGFELAFATWEGRGRMAVPRVDVNATDTPRTFHLKTLPIFPALRRTTGHVPRLRAALHNLAGNARR